MKYDHLIGRGFERWTSGTYTPAQKLSMTDYTHSVILNSGSYRSGKSEGSVRMALRHAISFPNASVGVFRQFQSSLKQSTMKSLLELTHPSWVTDWSNSEFILTLKNGSTILFAGLDVADKIGSLELTFALLDEAHEINEESKTMVGGRLSGPLKMPRNFPSLRSDLQEYVRGTIDRRQMVLAVNPKGKGHYIYRTFIDTPLAGHVAYTSNSLANPNLPPSYLLTQLSQYVRDPGSHGEGWLLTRIQEIRSGEADPTGAHLAPYLTVYGQRNLLGLWSSAEGAIWDIDPELHFTSTPIEHYDGIICGVDFGFNAPRAVLFKYTSAGTYQAFKYWHEQKSTPQDLINVLVGWEDKYAIDYIYVPPDQPGIIRELKGQLESREIVRKAKNQVLAGINSVASSLAKVELTFLNPPKVFRDETTGYEWEPDKDKPIKVADHYPDATRYAVFTHKARNKVGHREG